MKVIGISLIFILKIMEKQVKEPEVGPVVPDDAAGPETLAVNPQEQECETVAETPPEVPAETSAEAPAEAVAPDVEKLLAEAEERGYLRGRNERIAELMEQPSAVDALLPDTVLPDEPEILILNNIRPSIWD